MIDDQSIRNSNATQFYHNLGARSLSEWGSFRLEGPALTALAKSSADDTADHAVKARLDSAIAS